MTAAKRCSNWSVPIRDREFTFAATPERDLHKPGTTPDSVAPQSRPTAAVLHEHARVGVQRGVGIEESFDSL